MVACTPDSCMNTHAINPSGASSHGLRAPRRTSSPKTTITSSEAASQAIETFSL